MLIANFFLNLKSSKMTVFFVILLAFIIIGAGYFLYNKVIVGQENNQAVEEVDLTFDPEGPYALLYPRRDGNALVLNIKRTASYDEIRYELAYNAEGVDRGAQGTINTKEKKGEYEQEILFGSCSTGGKCVFDKDVKNGTLTLHIRKGKQAYRMITQWNMQKPDIELGLLVSGDNHFSFKAKASAEDLALIKFTIINELTGAPKLPNDRIVLGKVYALNAPIAKTLPAGQVSIELVEDPAADSQIARFDEALGKWVEYETKIDGSKLSASPDQGGVFTVLTSKKD